MNYFNGNSGLLTKRLSSKDDQKLISYGIGLTCLVDRASRSSAELSKHVITNTYCQIKLFSICKELERGFEELKEKIRIFKPKLLCFNGKGIYEEIVTKRMVNKKKFLKADSQV